MTRVHEAGRAETRFQRWFRKVMRPSCVSRAPKRTGSAVVPSRLERAPRLEPGQVHVHPQVVAQPEQDAERNGAGRLDGLLGSMAEEQGEQREAAGGRFPVGGDPLPGAGPWFPAHQLEIAVPRSSATPRRA